MPRRKRRYPEPAALEEPELPEAWKRRRERIGPDRYRRAPARSAVGAVDGADVDPGPFGRGRQDLEEKAPPIREKLRIAVILLHLFGCRSGERCRRAALRAHPRQAVDALLLAEDDHPVRTPGAAPTLHGVADLLRRTALAGDLPQLTFGEKSDPGTVGRPERVGRSFDARDLQRLHRVERADPDSGGVRHDQVAAVGRELEPAAASRGAQLTRRRQLEAHFARPLGARRTQEQARRDHREARNEQQECRQPWPLTPRRREARCGISGDASTHDVLFRSARHHFVQHEARIPDVAQPVLRTAREAAPQQVTDSGRRPRGQGRPVDLLSQDRGQSVGNGLAFEEPLAGQHFEEDDPERPDIGALVDRQTARLLRRHVRRRAEDHPELGPVRGRQGRRLHQRRRARELGRGATARAGLHRLGQSEIEDLGLSFTGSLYVLRFEITVDNSLVVGLLERLRDLESERKAFSKGKRPGLEAFGERRSGDELHDEGVRLAAGFHPVDLGDVRVVELREQVRLALEACETFLVRYEGRRQHLDRHLAPELGVGRAVDLPHSALAELGGDLVRAEAGARGGRHADAIRIMRRSPAAGARDRRRARSRGRTRRCVGCRG